MAFRLLCVDSNPGTSPLTSLLMTMNMGATLFRLTVDEWPGRVTREAARALGRLDSVGTLEAGKSCDLALWEIERPARTGLSHGLQSASCSGLEGKMKTALLVPGEVPLKTWREVYRGRRRRSSPRTTA